MAILLETGDSLLLESGDTALLEDDAGDITPDPDRGYGPGTFRLWIAFGTEAYASSLEASDTPWIDVTEHVREAQFATSQRASQFDTFTAGYGTFQLENATRLFDPAYAAGTYYGDFKRHVPIRVTGEHSGTRYTVWRGWVRDWQVGYRGRFDSVTTVRATDALGLMALHDIAPVTTPVYAGQETYARIATYLALMGFPIFSGLWTTSAVGQTGPLVATTHGDNVLTHLVDAATAEGGHLFADRDGVVTFESRVAPAILTRMMSSQASFDDTTEPTYEALELASIGENYRDLVRITAASGVAQEVDLSATDAAPVVFQKTSTPLQTDSSALAAAEYFADLYSTEYSHPRAITTTIATALDDLRTQLLPRRIRDRVDVTYSPPGGGADITADVFIDGMTHRVTPDRWQIRYQLSSADQFDNLDGPPSTWLVVGDATRGKVATGTVGY